MAYKFPSDEWIKALRDMLNASESYQRSAKDWEGDFIFISEADDTYPETAYLHLQLHHGSSPGAPATCRETCTGWIPVRGQPRSWESSLVTVLKTQRKKAGSLPGPRPGGASTTP